jgi:alpha-galactosidase
VDFIKLDYITPGSPDNGGNLPPNNSGSVIAYHNAIQQATRPMRLDISWKLERNETYFKIWDSNADSMRTDQDINNSGSTTFIAWATVQRAIDNYRDFISRVVATETEQPLSIYPDMDNWYVGNNKSITGVSDIKRKTIATHWIGAAANLISGSDMTRLDALGIKLLTDPAGQEVANFTARYPMQARNPGSGRNESKQLQAWIAGPDNEGDGRAIVVLANYGPDQGQGGFRTYFIDQQIVRATWEDLGLSGVYEVSDVWEHKQLGTANSEISAVLAEGESLMLSLLPS